VKLVTTMLPTDEGDPIVLVSVTRVESFRVDPLHHMDLVDFVVQDLHASPRILPRQRQVILWNALVVGMNSST
jgi:hypothetical protein